MQALLPSLARALTALGPCSATQQATRASALLATRSFATHQLAASTSAAPAVLPDPAVEAMSPHPPTTGTSPLTVRYPFAIDYYKDREAVVYTLDRRPCGLLRLPGEAFNAPVRIDILHRVVRYLRAKWQQGTHKAKSRAEVRGGGRKPRPQKKTGRSRQGSIRSPLWKGGGVVHGPNPRSHAHGLPRSTRLLGLKCALSARAHEERLFVVDSFIDDVRDYGALKDRLMRLTDVEAVPSQPSNDERHDTWLLVDSGPAGSDGGAVLRKWLKCSVVMEVLPPEQLTVYHILRHQRLVVTRAAAQRLAEQVMAPHRISKPAKHAWWLQRQAAVQAAVDELQAGAALQQAAG
jgi:large subunit ribosomal protein L4